MSSVVHQPHPFEQNREIGRRLLAITGAITLVLIGLITLLIIGAEVGPIGLVTGLVLATVPLPLYLALALWIDRFEPEPIRMLAWAFFWGATAATFFALILNTVGQSVVSSEFGSSFGEVYGSSISAPVVEESAKGIVLLAIYRWRRSELNGVLDGIVYASMVGLGFATTENVLYYGNSAAGANGVPLEATFFMRGVLSPFAHPVFTAMTGIGFGIAVASGRPLRRLAPAIGLLGAMLLHSLWNSSAGVGDGAGFVGVYFLIMIPIFIAVIVVSIVARRREGRMVRHQLQPELASGQLTADDVRSLSSVKTRRRAVKEAKRGGLGAGRKQFQEVATELAFLRHRMAKGAKHARGVDPVAAEAALRSHMLELRAGLPGAPAGVLAAAPAAEAGTPAAAPATATQTTAPDWYADPWGQARVRYWDGTAWTGHTAT